MSSASAIAGFRQSPARPGRTGSTRSPAKRRAAWTRKGFRSTTSPRSCGTSSATRSRGAGTAHDVGTLRVSDSQFYLGYLDKFKYFDRRSFLAPRNFLDDAKDGKLPAVSWIDPNFVDVSFIGPSGSNDDHPPSDIKAGQELVLKVYSALVKSPNWKKTMLVITYDEHGGFYDHVLPHPAQDDKPAFRTYGVRVPSIVVSPYTARASVSSVVYDHTSIIKTILHAFL